MKEVVLHVYDVTNSDSEKTNNTILQINRIFKDRIGLGGIFHSAVQVLPRPARPDPGDAFRLLASPLFLQIPNSHFPMCRVQVYGEEEWSFGFCENGSGVFSCPVSKNPMYTYRERIVLGETECTIATVNRILRELSRDWPGHSYDLLSRNCNHFCDVLCDRLGVPKLPGWVNRFANAGDTAVVVAENTAVKFRQAKTEIVNASRVAYRFMAGLTSKNQASQESPGSKVLSDVAFKRFKILARQFSGTTTGIGAGLHGASAASWLVPCGIGRGEETPPRVDLRLATRGASASSRCGPGYLALASGVG
ncbi:desumoylating isopeptidase 2 [Hordeum vulgare]|nr:desumoylating isopeptidase 2 [Hordeum vulgare]